MSGYAPIEMPTEIVSGVATAVSTETFVMYSSPVSTPGPNATVSLSGVYHVLTGAGVSELIVRCYRGDYQSGNATLVAAIGMAASASAFNAVPLTFVDSPGDVADLLYSITVIQSGAPTTAGSYGACTLMGFIE